MSPQQAREIIEDAAERIADWKSRLRINAGRGVETWDNPTGQLVSVSAPEEELVKEPQELTIFLWANTSMVSIEEPVYVPATPSYPGFLLDSGRTVSRRTGWYLHDFISPLNSGEYSNETLYKNPNETVPRGSPSAGYYNLRYDSGGSRRIAPLDYSYFLYNVRPTESIPRGALYTPQSLGIGFAGWEFTNRTTTTITVELSIRGYTPEYLADRVRRGLKPEFEKGQSVGSYDLMIRQTDAVKGPDFYVPPYTDENGVYHEGGLQWATNPAPTSSSRRVGFAPVFLTFNSSVNGPHVYSPGWTSQGYIDIMGYRKV
jgi:hypothetical protein